MNNGTLPQWAIEAGWTEQDIENGWEIREWREYCEIVIDDRAVSAWSNGDVMVSMVNPAINDIYIVRDVSPKVARSCAMAIAFAIQQAKLVCATGNEPCPTCYASGYCAALEDAQRFARNLHQ